jgi:hypothetical protein
MPLGFQGFIASSGPRNMRKRRRLSVPWLSMIASGLTALPPLFDIFSPSSPRMMPWWNSLLNGSSVGTAPMSKRTLCQNRA